MFVTVLFLLPSYLLFCITFSSAAVADRENLHIRPLAGNYYAITAQFTLTDNAIAKALRDTLQFYQLQEYHLSLVSGNWRPERWGLPMSPAGPTGAQLFAHFERNATDVDKRWRDLVHTLGGLFCASLSQMEPTLTVAQNFAFRPEGAIPVAASSDEQLQHPFLLDPSSQSRYAVLPTENVCTENLTPWKKSLPCSGGGKGIAGLLYPLNLYAAHWHSLTLDMRWVCSSMTSGGRQCLRPPVLQLLQTASAVVYMDKTRFTLTDLMGRAVIGRCPLAASGQISIELKANDTVTPEPADIIDLRDETRLVVYDLKNLKSGDHFNFRVQLNGSLSNSAPYTKSPVGFHVYLTGTGQQNGCIVSRISNHLPNALHALYSHVIPWILRVYFHTLTINCGAAGSLKPLVKTIRPGKLRQRAHYLELGLLLPANSDCFIRVDFDKLLLRWTEYPPDANRGFLIPAPVVTIVDHSTPSLQPWPSSSNIDDVIPLPLRIYGEVTIVVLPTPDFSMPYNVICFVCTVLALAFGPIHNLSTKLLTLKDRDELEKQRLSSKLKLFFQSSIRPRLQAFVHCCIPLRVVAFFGWLFDFIKHRRSRNRIVGNQPTNANANAANVDEERKNT